QPRRRRTAAQAARLSTERILLARLRRTTGGGAQTDPAEDPRRLARDRGGKPAGRKTRAAAGRNRIFHRRRSIANPARRRRGRRPPRAGPGHRCSGENQSPFGTRGTRAEFRIRQNPPQRHRDTETERGKEGERERKRDREKER